MLQECEKNGLSAPKWQPDDNSMVSRWALLAHGSKPDAGAFRLILGNPNPSAEKALVPLLEWRSFAPPLETDFWFCELLRAAVAGNDFFCGTKSVDCRGNDAAGVACAFADGQDAGHVGDFHRLRIAVDANR